MALAIYKPGQGYWTRVLTAVGLGVLALSGAFWLWTQLGAVSIAKSAWVMDLTAVNGTAAAGQEVALFADPRGDTRLGTGEVAAVEAAGRRVTISKIKLGTDADPVATMMMRSTATGPDGSPAFSASVTRKIGIDAFQRVYLQAGVALTIVLLSAGLIYWLVALKPGANEFLIAVDAEMRKVNWSTRREVLGSTWVVIVVCAIIAAVLFVVDIAFSGFFRWIGVLGA